MVAEEIEQIKLKINDISRSRLTYGISNINEGRQESSFSNQQLQERRRFSALFEESEVVGLQEDMRTVRKQLIDEEPRRRV